MSAKKKEKPPPKVSAKSQELLDVYENAFHSYINGADIPYIVISDARMALLKHIASLEAYRKRFFALAKRMGG